MRRWQECLLGGVTILALAVSSGCSDDDGDALQPTPTISLPTSTRTVPVTASTPTATPTSTPAMPPEVHSEVLIGSDEVGSGQLKAEYDYADPVHASFTVCLSGSGDRCEDGIAVYSVVSPGFDSLEEDEPEDSHFTLIDGTPITLTIISIDSGLSFKMGSLVVDGAGESLVLGDAPFHADIEAQVLVAGGAVRDDGWQVTFELTASGDAYERSEQYTLTYELEDE